ncbi:MAG TPA: hypothetical protein VEI02_01305 [Planctomycetota bacterium]|nr:hypothetical protein [Planctomycetota bacterium]
MDGVRNGAGRRVLALLAGAAGTTAAALLVDGLSRRPPPFSTHAPDPTSRDAESAAPRVATGGGASTPNLADPQRSAEAPPASGDAAPRAYAPAWAEEPEHDSRARRVSGADERPKFEDYPAVAAFRGRPATPDLASDPDARRFRTRLRDGAAAGPNFAGDFAFVTWGCGTNCQSSAVVSAVDGRVIFAPFVSELGVEFRRDSSLVVENPPTEYEAAAAMGVDPRLRTWYGGTTWWIFDGARFLEVAYEP